MYISNIVCDYNKHSVPIKLYVVSDDKQNEYQDSFYVNLCYCLNLVPCVLSYRWVHFSRAVLF